LFVFLNVLVFILEQKTDIRKTILEKAKIEGDFSAALTNEACIEFIEFKKAFADLDPANFSKDFTKKAINSLKPSLEDFEGIFARLLVREKQIDFSFKDETLEQLKQDLRSVRDEMNNSLSEISRGNLIEREKSIEEKIKQLKSLFSTKKEFRTKRDLVKDNIQEIFIKLKGMDIKMETHCESLENDLRAKISDAKENLEIMEKAIERAL
jgi:DNA repair exonuclease SbcCD ATPase subunit